MQTTSLRIGASLAAVLVLAGAAPPPQPKAGQPIQGLTANQRLLFEEGLEYYTRPITAAEGLGPAFNQPSCAACHESPIGGWGATSVTHFGRSVNGPGAVPLSGCSVPFGRLARWGADVARTRGEV